MIEITERMAVALNASLSVLTAMILNGEPLNLSKDPKPLTWLRSMDVVEEYNHKYDGLVSIIRSRFWIDGNPNDYLDLDATILSAAKRFPWIVVVRHPSGSYHIWDFDTNGNVLKR